MSISQSVDPHDIIPKYFQLVNILRHKIEDAEWCPYDSIPSERALEEIYHVSRITIRQAIAILIRQGYLYSEQGKGTFVAPQKLQKSMLELTSFTEDMLKRGMEPGQLIISIGNMKPPAKVSKILEISPSTEVFRIERVRLANKKPIGLQTSYLVFPENGTITKEDLENEGSLYTILQNKFHLIPTEAEETIEATLASPEEAVLLQTAEGSPLLLSSRILWDQTRRPIEFVKILYRGDRYRYVARLTR
jgi:GntR family transcriptional regulator